MSQDQAVWKKYLLALYIGMWSVVLVAACIWLIMFLIGTLGYEKKQNPDLDVFDSLVNDKTRLILLNSPSNPTGGVMGLPALEHVAAAAQAHDAWVLSDEIYSRMVYEGEHLSPAQFPGMAERTFVVGSLSKSHAMPGWRIGWAAGPAEGIAHMAELSNSMLFGQPPFAMDAATKLLASGDRTPERVRDLYRARRDALCDALEGVEGLSFVRPHHFRPASR